MIHNQFDLDTPVLQFGEQDQPITLEDMYTSVSIFGNTGSGKTTGSSAFIVQKLLGLGCGALVLTCKPTEKDLWINYCEKTNRTQDLIIVEVGGKHTFNFWDYLQKSNRAEGITITSNIVETLRTVIASNNGNKETGNDDSFWREALNMLITNAISLLLLSKNKISLDLLYTLAVTAPRNEKQEKKDENIEDFDKIYSIAETKVNNLVKEFYSKLSDVDKKKYNEDKSAFEEIICDKIPEAFQLKQIHHFFHGVYKNLSEKTKSIIDFSFSGLLFSLMQEPFYSLFAKQSTFEPEACLKGKIIILALPTKIFGKAGKDCQLIFKYLWQKAMEQRKVEENSIPVIFFADENQNFILETDLEFQPTARSSRIITICITQNIENYYAVMSGNKFEQKVNAYLSLFGIKIFHSNSYETNSYASKIFGQGYQENYQWSNSFQGNMSSSKSKSYELVQMVRPEDFNLKVGGKRNNYIVEAYIHVLGQPLFANGMNFKKVAFSQTH